MIPQYVRPQLLIKQLLDRTAAATVGRLNALVIGPQYRLNRYGKESNIPSVVFDSAGDTLAYEYRDANGAVAALPGTEVVDLDSVKLHGEKLEALLATFTTGATNPIKIDSVLEPSVLKIDTVNFKGGTIDTLFDDRNVAVGDVVYIDDGLSSATSIRRRKVTGFRGKTLSSSYGANTAGDNSVAGRSAYNPVVAASATSSTVSAPSPYTITLSGTFNGLVRGSKLDGKYGEEFTITVRTGGAPGTAKVDISSASGLWSATNVSTTNSSGNYSVSHAELGGHTVVLTKNAGADVTVGQVFKFRTFGLYELPVMNNTTGQLRISNTGSGYTGTKDTTYLIQIVTGTAFGSNSATGAVVRISDTAGYDTVSEVTLTDNVAFNLGTHGLQAKFTALGDLDQGGLRAGDVFFLKAVASKASTTEFDRIVLDGPAVDTTVFNDASTALAVDFRLEYSGSIAKTQASDETAWAPTANGVEVDASLALYVAERTASKWVAFVDEVGKLYVSYRALVPPAYGESFRWVDDSSDIVENYGSIDIDNDLGFGASFALSGAQGQRVAVLRVAGTTADDYAAALKKIEATDEVYALAVLSDDETVKQVVATHVLAMSGSTKKNFRRAYVGTDSPGEYLKASEDSEGEAILATISDLGGSNVLLTTQSPGVDFTTLGLVAGDFVKVPALDDQFEIESVLSASEIVLAAGPTNPLAPASPVEIWKADTPESQAAYVKQISEGLGTRRVANVWTERGTRFIGGVPVVIPSKFIAAEIAGLRSAVLPQQGLTRTEITIVTDAPAMHARYTPDLLDEIAAAGTFVITQEVEGGAVFIRHQLTTETDKGSLYYEDSITVNLDNISFQIKDVLDGYIGKYNVTPATIAEIRGRVFDILDDATKTDFDTTIGPALIRFDNLVVEADSVLKDRINVDARLFMPLPLNVIDVTLQASVDLSL